MGGCDLYTTKAAGSDKKLYKTIDKSLENQYESLLRLSASLSPPLASAADSSLNLSRSSPFGPLSQISSRRTYAYLIATLNASHPDYDFSHILRPSDFRRERSLRTVMNTIDTTLYNLRPRPTPSLAPPQWSQTTQAAGPPLPAVSQCWGPRMWALIDKEMDLRDCNIYCYAPEEDPYDGEDGAIWSSNYFFFNKERKRVCYVHIRGLSIMSHSPAVGPSRIGSEKTGDNGRRRSMGASKRAKYWLGDRADDAAGGWGEDDDDESTPVRDWDDDGVDLDNVLEEDEEMDYDLDDEDDDVHHRTFSDSSMRGVSEDIAASMEV
jgi:Maf1 regulator